jgi:hypothetical protein
MQEKDGAAELARDQVLLFLVALSRIFAAVV